MPKYLETNATSKVGIAHVLTIVVESNCIFHEIHQENDVGIDAIIEFVKDKKPTAKNIGVQIKSGASYFDKTNNECLIPVGSHYDYWKNYSLPVYGIVYLPEENCAYWTNIKEHLKENPNIKTIRFPAKKLNAFDSDNFKKLILPSFTGEIPKYTYQEALKFFRSQDWDETELGLHILFYEHTDKNEVWDEFVKFFQGRDVIQIPTKLIYYLAHIPWHGDIWGGRDKITDESKKHAKNLIAKFDIKDITKLLDFIDENGIGRGTIGQSVEAIVSSIPESNEYLSHIVRDNDLRLEIRESAAAIFAYNNQGTARNIQISINLLEEISSQSEISQMMITYLKEYGGLWFYS